MNGLKFGLGLAVGFMLVQAGVGALTMAMMLL